MSLNTRGYGCPMPSEAERRTVERRKVTRQKSFLRGMIYFNNRRNVVDCLIRDISPYGARLIFSDAVTTPDQLDVYIPSAWRGSRSRSRGSSASSRRSRRTPGPNSTSPDRLPPAKKTLVLFLFLRYTARRFEPGWQ